MSVTPLIVPDRTDHKLTRWLSTTLWVLALCLLSACAAPKTAPKTDLVRSPDQGSEVAVRAMSMIGKPYRWGGDNPRAGFDCSGLVHYVYQDALGVALPRTARLMSRQGKKVGKSGLRPGDLVFFNTGRRFSHVGIYVGNGRFVHSPSRGKTIRLARLDNRYWDKRFSGGRRPEI
ncbi:MAG: C40 family peptidase [Burkholderiaceae bacterium]